MRPAPPPGPLDVSRAQSARLYNALLDGKDNFAADRACARRLRQEAPTIGRTARELRRFLQRAVHYLAADYGIRQFLDIGCGLPHAPNVHDVAHAVDPSCRIAYIDPDPLVGAHARALLTSPIDATTVFAPGSLDDVDDIFANDDVRGLLDFSRPVAVLLSAVLHFVPDDRYARRSLDRLTATLAPGSLVAISHLTFDPLPPAHAARLTELADKDPGHGAVRARTHTELTALLHGFDLAPPGLVPVVDWYPDRHPQPHTTADQVLAYGAVARPPPALPITLLRSQ